MLRDKVDIVELFRSEKSQNRYVKVSAPMVRYSKLEFRALLRRNHVNMCFTPMIIADSFSQSQEARLNEFTTNKDDNPLIVQFAAKNSADMLSATQLVYPYTDGVDLNCGCPQSWAINKGYGCGLLKQPELVRDIIQCLRRNLPSSFSCSAKLRLLQKDVVSTIELGRTLEACGATFLTIHGRTPWQKSSEPLDIQAMAELKKSLRIPLICNGNVRTLNDADELYAATQCDGVMAARGILTNPALFTGANVTTHECIQNWTDLAYEADTRMTFQCFHHHLTFMLEKFMPRKLRVVFNSFTKKSQIFAFLDEQFDVRPRTDSVWLGESTVCTYEQKIPHDDEPERVRRDVWSAATNDGKFFTEFTMDDGEVVDATNCSWDCSSLFVE